jgi:hypothetical protein
VEFDRVSAKSDVVWWIGLVSKSQLEAKLLGVEFNRPLDVTRAENRVGFFEHCRSQSFIRALDLHSISRHIVFVGPHCSRPAYPRHFAQVLRFARSSGWRLWEMPDLPRVFV